MIDADGDGEPDPADGTVSGTVTLPSDPGTGGVTVTAEMIEFAGRDPGAPLSVVTTADGVRDYTLPRLPAGRYVLTVEALGYFAGTQTVDVRWRPSGAGGMVWRVRDDEARTRPNGPSH